MRFSFYISVYFFLFLFNFKLYSQFNVINLKTYKNNSFITFNYTSFSQLMVNNSYYENTLSDFKMGDLGSPILVYPSPCPNFKCQLGFRVINGQLSNMNLHVFNMQGTKIIETTIDAQSGYNKIDLYSLVSAYPGTGMYYILLFDSENKLLDKTKFVAVSW